jgi:hypothetical protein
VRKTATPEELTVRSLLKRALEGDVKSAELLLDLRIHAQKFGGTGIEKIYVHDWFPDYPGQTGEQKTREHAEQKDSKAPDWWNKAAQDPAIKDT